MLGFVLLSSGGRAEPVRPSAARDIPLTATRLTAFSPAHPAEKIFGQLEFLGGLVLKSDDPDFGGLSALLLEPNGSDFIALTDRAHWFTGQIRSEDGAPVGIDKARLVPMLAWDGRLLRRTRLFDSEGLTRQDGRLVVSVERTHDLLSFETIHARAKLLEVPAGAKKLKRNAGIEALGTMPARSSYAGHLVAIAEEAPAASANAGSADAGSTSANADHPGFLIGPRGGTFMLKNRDGYAVTDLCFLPSGDMLVLERRLGMVLNFGIRIRRVALEAIRPGALLDGAVLLEASLAQEIDNFEGIAAHKDLQGRTIITLVSDDNFSFLQRSLLVRFALLGE